MQKIIDTIIDSINELIAEAIKVLPGLLGALIVIMLTRYIAIINQEFANKIALNTIQSKSLQILFAKSIYVTTWVIGSLLACVLAFPGLNLGDIVATLGLGSVAIGFAFQDIFKNFLSGILPIGRVDGVLSEPSPEIDLVNFGRRGISLRLL